MRLKATPEIREQLKEVELDYLCNDGFLEVDDDAFAKWSAEVKAQYDLPAEKQEALTVLFCLTHPDHAPINRVEKTGDLASEVMGIRRTSTDILKNLEHVKKHSIPQVLAEVKGIHEREYYQMEMMLETMRHASGVLEQAINRQTEQAKSHRKLEREQWSKLLKWLAMGWGILVLATLLGGKAHAQATSQLDCIQFQNNLGTVVKTFCAPFKMKAGSNITFSASGSVLTIAASGALGAGFDTISSGTNTTAAMVVGAGASLDFSTTGTINASSLGGVASTGFVRTTRTINGLDLSANRFLLSTNLGDFSTTSPSSSGQIPIWDSTAPNAAGGTGAFVPGDPLVQGLTAHDAVGTSTNPVAAGGYASAAAPTDVSADGDIVRAWHLRNGSQVVNLASGGTLVTIGQKAMASSVPVVLASDQSTVPVSAASLPLPTGAAQDSTLTGGTQKAIVRGGAKGTTSAADATSTASGANHQAIDVALYDGSGNQLGVSGAPVRVDPTGTTPQPASQSGTWTVQPGNTANTTPWLTTDSATSNTGSAVPTKAGYIGGTDGTNLVGYYVDPCQRGAKSYAIINLSTATTSRFAAPAASKKTYICSIVLVAAGADNVNIIEGTGGTCGTGTAGVLGGTTAATGLNLAANGGLTMGNGQGAIMATAGTNVDMCIITSAAVQLSGMISYVQY